MRWVLGLALIASWPAWAEAIMQLWQPILVATIVVALGFGVFGLSAFPPTKRFGFSIVAGTLMVPPAALLVLPVLADRVRLWRIHLAHLAPPRRLRRRASE